jgi:hypothetical protein
VIDMRIKQLFFDRPRVQRAVSRANRQALSRAGALVMTAARQSIRRAPYRARKPRGRARTDFRTQSAPPGAPPYSQTGLLKRFIFFGYDPQRESVVIGPAKLNKPGAAPRVLEHGGTATVLRRRRGKIVRQRVRIAPRPFMGPALEKEQPKLPKLWAGSVRG